ncbi:MAG: endolytic transglycosylase MltG [Deltaproteobacteria bacterium]|nr:endolytic transglycosylase MltG [Deltaproteobacteria bacterium]
MKRRSVFKFALGFILLIVAGIGGGFLWLNRVVKRPHTHASAEKVITIEPSTSTRAIIARLHREGVLEAEWPTLLYVKLLARQTKFKTGDYEFPSPISPLEVIRQLARGEVATHTITVPEGYTQFDIAALLAAPLPGMKQFPPPSQKAALELFKNTRLIADLDPRAQDLEGYLFPDTYEYTSKTTREQLVEAMVKRFRKVYTPEMQQQAAALGMTTREALTMASLVEKEAKVDGERELISQVYHKRLKMGERLACDPTVIYAALLAGKYRGKIYRSDLDRDSPYNTYLRRGLPPGPIASPGKRSLQAAINPATTDYLYFVVDVTRNDGSHKFSTNSGEHERAVAALRQQERQQQSARPTH